MPLTLVAPKFALFQSVVDPDGNHGSISGLCFNLPWSSRPGWSYFVIYPNGMASCPWLPANHVEEWHEEKLSLMSPN